MLNKNKVFFLFMLIFIYLYLIPPLKEGQKRTLNLLQAYLGIIISWGLLRAQAYGRLTFEHDLRSGELVVSPLLQTNKSLDYDKENTILRDCSWYWRSLKVQMNPIKLKLNHYIDFTCLIKLTIKFFLIVI